MVATPWMEKNATTLKLPAQREHWFLSEQSILAEAAERDIMPFLDGSYHPKPMYPEVRIVRYGYQKQLDGHRVPMTDADGETIYRENVNGGIKPWLAASIQKLKGVKKQLKPKDVCLVLKQAFLTNFPDMAEIAEMTLSPGASGGAAQSITFTVNKPLGKDDVIVL
jgi:hypothetical protein